MGKHVTRPLVIVIAALARENRCIGRNLRLPWRIPEDMRRFKRLTSGFPMIMGRLTCEGLVRDFGGPLPNRRMLVLTSNPNANIHPSIEPFVSLKAALNHVELAEQLFIAGGARVYEEGIPIADRLELTLIDRSYEGDTFFPPYEHLIGTEFALVNERLHEGFTFATYDRIRPSKVR